MRVFRAIRNFVNEAYQELRRVVWPTPDELKAYTYLVVFVIGIVAVWIGALEYIWVKVSNWVHLYGGPNGS